MCHWSQPVHPTCGHNAHGTHSHFTYDMIYCEDAKDKLIRTGTLTMCSGPLPEYTTIFNGRSHCDNCIIQRALYAQRAYDSRNLAVPCEDGRQCCRRYGTTLEELVRCNGNRNCALWIYLPPRKLDVYGAQSLLLTLPLARPQ